MHINIKKHQKDPNFLTHDLWSKSKLVRQHIHLELLQILSYAITFKLSINHEQIFMIDIKIMINSPEVHLGITRSHAEVKHKNLFIFSYKNHLDRNSINT
jgi:hypothetical protein